MEPFQKGRRKTSNKPHESKVRNWSLVKTDETQGKPPCLVLIQAPPREQVSPSAEGTSISSCFSAPVPGSTLASGGRNPEHFQGVRRGREARGDEHSLQLLLAPQMGSSTSSAAAETKVPVLKPDSTITQKPRELGDQRVPQALTRQYAGPCQETNLKLLRNWKCPTQPCSALLQHPVGEQKPDQSCCCLLGQPEEAQPEPMAALLQAPHHIPGHPPAQPPTSPTAWPKGRPTATTHPSP